MMQKDRIWWVSGTALALTGFSYFAGSGVRQLYTDLSRSSARNSSRSPLTSPQYASASPHVPDADLRPATLYMDVLKKLQLYYVEQLPTNTKLAYGSIDAMLNQLDDPNTRLLSKAEVDELQSAPGGQFNGLGAVLTVKRFSAANQPDMVEGGPKTTRVVLGAKTITVVTVAPGSPAEKAGLQPNDRITELDGHWIAPAHVSYRILTQLTDPLGPQDLRPRTPDDPIDNRPPDPRREKAKQEADEAGKRWKNATDLASTMELLNTANDQQHELTIMRGRPAKTIKVTVTLGSTQAEMFSSRKLNATTGYVQILALNGKTQQQTADALADFQKSGIRNLVLDLRHSAGGSLEVARDTAGLLLGDTRFAVVKERDANRKLVERPLAIKGATVRFKPAALHVLVDGGTAGASELLAAALRDQAGAKLIGSTTFGDGAEHELEILENGAGLSLTRAHILTPKGVDFDGKGLKPDVTPQGDPLDAATKALSSSRLPQQGRSA